MMRDRLVTIAAVSRNHYRQLLTGNPSVPQALENVVIKATAKKLTDRYQSVCRDVCGLVLVACLTIVVNEPKHGYLMSTTKADTKTLPKVSQSTLTSRFLRCKHKVRSHRLRKPSQQVSEGKITQSKPVRNGNLEFVI